jgi:hypothetical protein
MKTAFILAGAGGLVNLRRPHGFSGNHSRHCGQGEYVWNHGGPGEVGAHELCALFHRRHRRDNAWIRWGWRAFTNDSLNTFGGAGVVEIPRLQNLLHYICENGFEHHVAANFSTVAGAVHEAAVRYLGWQMYWHRN